MACLMGTLGFEFPEGRDHVSCIFVSLHLVHSRCSEKMLSFFFVFLETSGKTFHGSDLCFRKYGPCGGLNNGPQRCSHPNPWDL